MLRVHVLQHVSFEGLGTIAAWLEARQAEVTWTRFYESAALPDLNTIDFIIALGGPMSVNDEEQFPWLKAEKQFIFDAINQKKIILGICLGCQLIASVLGASVYPGRQKEIGWFPVFAIPRGKHNFVFPELFKAFHWHGETFDLPPNAIRLASSALYPNQAFLVDGRILGLQFHLETTPESVAAMTQHCRHELRSEPFVQSVQNLLGVPRQQ
jgi:GMP synthase-like glutamine amidotransferase